MTCDDPNGTGQEFTLGTVVGEIRMLGRAVELMEDRLNSRINEVKTDLKDLIAGARGEAQKRLDLHEVRLSKQERSTGAWRWIERVGAFFGALLAGWWGGKSAGG